jgi:GAF domain-containing protein
VADDSLPQFTLEAVDSSEAGAGMGGMFNSEAFATVPIKLASCEALLNICVKELGFKDFMTEIMMVFLRGVRSEAGSILELDPTKKFFFFRSVSGQSSGQINNFTVPVGQGIVGHVAESKTPKVFNNVEENRIHLKSIEKSVGFETRNMIAAPILIRGSVFGVVELLNRIGEENYSAQDVELISYICEYAGKAIESRLCLNWAVAQGKSGHKEKAA